MLKTRFEFNLSESQNMNFIYNLFSIMGIKEALLFASSHSPSAQKEDRERERSLLAAIKQPLKCMVVSNFP